MSILDNVYKEEVYFGLYQALFTLCKDMQIVLYCLSHELFWEVSEFFNTLI